MTVPRIVIESGLRELVRLRGVDPSREPEAVRRLLAEVIDDYEERAVTPPLPPIGDLRADLLRSAFDAVAGFGPLQRLLDDPSIEEIWINEPGKVFVARRGRSELTTVVLDPGQLADLVERMLRRSGRRLDLSTPFVDATLPDGSRLHVVIPDITRKHMAINIRKFVLAAGSLDELVMFGSLSPEAARFLEAAVLAGLNIIVSGGTQAGKTTFLNALLAAVPAHERIILCEEVGELHPRLPDVVAMQTRQPNLEGSGEISLRRLVIESLRMRPSRLVVGEVRQHECLDLLLALNSGIPGMCSVHANTAREALAKLCTLPLLAGENVPSGFVLPTVASCVDLVVQLSVGPDGRRRVREIVSVPGRIEGPLITATDIFTMTGDRLVWAGGELPVDRFTERGIDVGALALGDLTVVDGRQDPDRASADLSGLGSVGPS